MRISDWSSDVCSSDLFVDGALAETLSAIYEVDFLGFSYGFRPGRNPHQALSSLHTAIMSQRVTWVLDADIRSFFDSVDHEWLLRMLAHRIADPRVLRLVRRSEEHTSELQSLMRISYAVFCLKK